MQDIEPRSEESADEVSGSLDHQASDVMFCFDVCKTTNYMSVSVHSLANPWLSETLQDIFACFVSPPLQRDMEWNLFPPNFLPHQQNIRISLKLPEHCCVGFGLEGIWNFIWYEEIGS